MEDSEETRGIVPYKVITTYPRDTDWNGQVVLLWGWFGAQDRALAKYADMHRARGRAVVRSIAPSAAVMLKWATVLGDIADYTCSRAFAIRKPGEAVWLHAFSNGGAFVYEQLLLNQRHDVFRSLSGAIFDSAPAVMDPAKGLEVITSFTRSTLLRGVLALSFRAWENVRCPLEHTAPPAPCSHPAHVAVCLRRNGCAHGSSASTTPRRNIGRP